MFLRRVSVWAEQRDSAKLASVCFIAPMSMVTNMEAMELHLRAEKPSCLPVPGPGEGWIQDGAGGFLGFTPLSLPDASRPKDWALRGAFVTLPLSLGERPLSNRNPLSGSQIVLSSRQLRLVRKQSSDPTQ